MNDEISQKEKFETEVSEKQAKFCQKKLKEVNTKELKGLEKAIKEPTSAKNKHLRGKTYRFRPSSAHKSKKGVKLTSQNETTKRESEKQNLNSNTHQSISPYLASPSAPYRPQSPFKSHDRNSSSREKPVSKKITKPNSKICPESDRENERFHWLSAAPGRTKGTVGKPFSFLFFNNESIINNKK